MSASWNDEGLARLVGSGGEKGLYRYGLWWRVCEILADQLGPKDTAASVSYTISRWSALLSLRASGVHSALTTLTLTRGVSVLREGDEIRVTIPNLLKYRDEYSKKSGHAPDTVGSREEGEAEKKRGNKEHQASSYLSDFLSAWNENRGTLSEVLALSSKRREKLQTRIKGGITIERFIEAVKLCATTRFLAGGNERKWRASFDWLIESDSNLLKVLEGQYADPAPKTTQQQAPTAETFAYPNRAISLDEIRAKAGIQ
jgi:hypothetical protein